MSAAGETARSTTALGALDWIKSHRAQGGGVVVSSTRRELYPEVTGYLVPTLLRRGEKDLALAFAKRLIAAQKSDGSFADPSGRSSYAFDTGQAVRGLVAAAPFAPELIEPLRRACAWLVDRSTDGRFPAPTGSDWSLGARGAISEGVHLYVLPGILGASEVLGDPSLRAFVAKSMDWYARHVELAEFARPNQLTHLYAYVMEALIELGASELAALGMKEVAERQHATGLVPAYHDVPWLCTPGQFQCALVWARLGDTTRATRAFEFLRPFRNASGGFFGSYGPGADYFAAEEPSWIAKFEMDAEDAIAAAKAPRPAKAIARPAPEARPAPRAAAIITPPAAPKREERRSPSTPEAVAAPTNLRPAEWNAAIAGREDARTVAARVARGESKRWLLPILQATAEGDGVLELGSGTGELSAALASAGRKTTGLDFSSDSLALARDVFAALGKQGAFVEGDVTARLPFPDGAFDVVWSSGLLEHFNPAVQEHIVRESARVSRRAVVALVPNAASVAYRLGKHLQEQSGAWSWGKEDPFLTLRPAFEAAGLVDVDETTVAPEHALEFLNGTKAEPMKAHLAAWLKSLPEAEREALGQGYLLVSVGRKGAPNGNVPSRGDATSASATATTPRPGSTPETATKHVLAIVPNDPLKAYADAGYPDLTSYFNPGAHFDEVVCLSPHETSPGTRYGVRIVPTRPEELASRCAEYGVTVLRAYDLPSAARVAPFVPQGLPFVVSVHDTDPKRVPKTLPSPHLWLPVSDACATLLVERGADPTRVARFSNRVRLDVFRPERPDGEQAAFDARFPGKIRILHVGRHSAQKNQDALVAALPKLGSDYVAIFVGLGEIETTRLLARRFGVLDRCVFIESVPNEDLAAFYRSAEVFCVPSRWEGFGVVFIEAAACGAAIVTADIGPMNEFLSDGTNALLLKNYEDPAALADAVRRAAADLPCRAALKAAAPAVALPFGKEAVDAREIAAYERVAPKAVATTLARPRAATFGVHPLGPDMAGDWERIVLASPDAWLYHTLGEQILLEEAWKGVSHSFLVERGGRLVGVVPLQSWPNEPKTLWSTLMGPAGPALVRDLDAGERAETSGFIHGVLKEMLRLGKAKTLRMILPPLAPSQRAAWGATTSPLAAYGYADWSTKTSVLDLSLGEERLWSGMRREYRTCINKATREGVVVRAADSVDDIDRYYALHTETYVRTGVRPHPRAYFAAIYEQFVSTGRAEWIFAERDGLPLGAVNVARFGDASLYWTGAYSAAGLECNVAKLLQWEAAKRSMARGCVVHETGEIVTDAGEGSKDEGIGTFKRRFGGVLVPFWKGILRA